MQTSRVFSFHKTHYKSSQFRAQFDKNSRFSSTRIYIRNDKDFVFFFTIHLTSMVMVFEMTANINIYIWNSPGFSRNASAHHATKYIRPVTAHPPDRPPRLQRSHHASIFPSTLITFGLARIRTLRYLSPHLSDKDQGRTFDWTRCALTSLRLMLNARTQC